MEDNVCIIITTSPRLIDVPSRVEPTFLSNFKNIIRRIGRETKHFKMVVLHNMDHVVLKGIIGYVYRAKAKFHNSLSP